MSEVIIEELPDLTLLDEDYAAQLARLKAQYQTVTGTYPRASYPETFLLEQFAYEVTLLRQLINAEGRQNLLAYAEGARLDHVGALLDVARLVATPARVTLRFAFADGAPALTIPLGTAVRAADGETVFATDAAAAVPAGAATWDVLASCTTVGTDANGFEAGEITALLQTVPYVSGVSNLAVSMGGAADEADARYRQRIHLAPAKFSVAGSEQAYVYHTYSAHPAIADVAVWGDAEAPGEVQVCALLAGGLAPDSGLVATILAALSADRVRPLTDLVLWTDPDPVAYSIAVELQIYASHAALAATAQAAALARLTGLAAAWGESLGRDLVPEAVVERCQGLAGVYRAVVTAPVYAALERWEFPACAGITVTTAVVQEAA